MFDELIWIDGTLYRVEATPWHGSREPRATALPLDDTTVSPKRAARYRREEGDPLEVVARLTGLPFECVRVLPPRTSGGRSSSAPPPPPPREDG